MTDSNYLEKVSHFMNMFNQPVLNKPTIPNEDRCELRVSLLQEELNELKIGIQNKDIVEIADALVDLQYVLTGAVHEFGLGHIFKELFEEVQSSNMSKLLKYEDIKDTEEFYNSKGVEVYFKQYLDTPVWRCYRSSDNKVLKNINYKKPNLKTIVENG